MLAESLADPYLFSILFRLSFILLFYSLFFLFFDRFLWMSSLGLFKFYSTYGFFFSIRRCVIFTIFFFDFHEPWRRSIALFRYLSAVLKNFVFLSGQEWFEIIFGGDRLILCEIVILFSVIMNYIRSFFLGDSDHKVFEVFVSQRAIRLKLRFIFINAIEHPVILLFLFNLTLPLTHIFRVRERRELGGRVVFGAAWDHENIFIKGNGKWKIEEFKLLYFQTVVS